MSLPEAIFFDWDGTLVDSFSFLQSAHEHVLSLLGMTPAEGEWFYPYFGKPRDFIYSDIYGPKATDAQKHFEAYVVLNHTKLIKKAPGTEALLTALFELNIVMGVVTNKKGDFVRAEIKAFGWDKYFKSVVGAGEAKEDKPSAAPLELAVGQTGYKGKSILFIGDTEADLLCAQRYGCPSVFLHPNPQDFEWLGNYRPIHITDDCNGLKEFLLQNA